MSVTDAWVAAQEARREAVWHNLPNRIVDIYEQGALTDADTQFLAAQCSSRSAIEATSALRALASVGEESANHRDVALAAIERAMQDDRAHVRAVSIECAWQVCAVSLLPRLRDMTEHDDNEEVREIGAHVTRILGGGCDER